MKRLNGEAETTERHKKTGQSHVEQCSGFRSAPLLHSSQQDLSALSRIEAEAVIATPESIRNVAIKTTIEIILRTLLFMVLLWSFTKRKSRSCILFIIGRFSVQTGHPIRAFRYCFGFPPWRVPSLCPRREGPTLFRPLA